MQAAWGRVYHLQFERFPLLAIGMSWLLQAARSYPDLKTTKPSPPSYDFSAIVVQNDIFMLRKLWYQCKDARERQTTAQRKATKFGCQVDKERLDMLIKVCFHPVLFLLYSYFLGPTLSLGDPALPSLPAFQSALLRPIQSY